jgi:polyketide cyclase/dehydrase/lipid transport protein
MRTESLTLHGAIPAPMDRVFALLANPETMPDWLPGCYEVQGVVKKGAQLAVRFGPRASMLHIVDFDVPTALGWTEIGARTGSKTFFQLGFAGATTALKMLHTWPAPGLGTWFRTRFNERRNPNRMLDQTLQNLRKLTTR